MLLCCHTYAAKLKNTWEWHNKFRVVAIYMEREARDTAGGYSRMYYFFEKIDL